MSESAPPPVVEPEAVEQPVAAKQVDYLKMLPQEIQDAVKLIKDKGISVYMTFLGDKGYLFRTMNVMEWLKVQTLQEQRAKAEGATEDYLQQALYEDIVVRTSLGVVVSDEDGKETLAPPINDTTVKGQPAGVPQSLSQQVMFQSGFDSNPMTVKL